MWPRRESSSRSGRGTDFRPALALGTADSGNNNNNNSTSNKKSTITAVEGEGPCGGGETLHTTVVSGNDELGGEAKSSPSIMELFDTNDVVAAAREQAAARDSNKTATAAAAAAAAGAAEASPAVAMARRHSLGRGRSKRYSTDSLRPSSGAWDHRNGLPAHKKAASFSGGVPRAGRGSGGSVGGAERHGYLSFSEVQVDEEDDTDDCLGHNSSSTASSSSSSKFGREMPHRRRKKRERAWKLFLAVMQEHGLRVRKYHRNGKGWAHRIVKYDPTLPGLRWKSSKWWDSDGGQIPLRDVLDVERRGKVVWVKCLHLGTIGFEASLETDAVVFYLAMDSLLDTRCGVSNDSSVGGTGGREASGPRLPGIPAA